MTGPGKARHGNALQCKAKAREGAARQGAAQRFELARLRKILRVPEADARKRITLVSHMLYQQALGKVLAQVSEELPHALSMQLVLTSAAGIFGLSTVEAGEMNIQEYRAIAAKLLQCGVLSATSMAILQQIRRILQLSEREASSAFIGVAGPLLQKTVDEVTALIHDMTNDVTAKPANSAYDLAKKLSSRSDELGLAAADASATVVEGLLATMCVMYNSACRAARGNQPSSALANLDILVAFASIANRLLISLRAVSNTSALQEPMAPLTLLVDSVAARKLYGLAWKRELDGNGDGLLKIDELVRLMQISQEDQEVVRVEIGKPRLQSFLTTVF